MFVDFMVPKFLRSSSNKKHIRNMQAHLSGFHNITKI